MIEFKQWDAYWNNFNNWDEALLSDSNRPRDEFGLRINPWRQMDKWDFASTTKNFYLDQITAIWWKEITWVSWDLVHVVIPLWFWTDFYKDLPLSTYWIDINDALSIKWGTYVKWKLSWSFTEDWGIIIPASWSYSINYYSEVWFDATQWQTVFSVAVLNKEKNIYYKDAKITATNPDNTGTTILQDLKQWDVVYLAGIHSSTSWKKALYIWTVTIFKLS